MSKFEYKAVPAPHTGTKAKGVKTTEERFALKLSETLNEMAAEGWEYVRAETLPCDERKGLTGTQTTFQNMLIFKRFKQTAQPMALEGSEPRPVLDTRAAPVSRPVSEPVAPRRVTTRPPESTNIPPLGAARDD